MTFKDFNNKQAQWTEFLAEFNFWITYQLSKSGTKPDFLTRKPGDLTDDALISRYLYQYQTILK